MKTALLLFIVSMLASPIAAQPVHNLHWDDCSVGGTSIKWFACDTNAGSHTLVSSFTAPAGISLWYANEVEIYVSTMTTVPDWWRLRNQTGQTGQCRNGALTVSPDFSAGPSSCLSPYTASTAGGIATYQLFPSGMLQFARLLIVWAVPAGEEHPLVEGAEYYSSKIVVSNIKTTGSGVCAGCATPANLKIIRTKVYQPVGTPGGDVEITLAGSNVEAKWQGDCYYDCYQFPCVWHCTTPATRPTWGSIKALYR